MRGMSCGAELDQPGAVAPSPVVMTLPSFMRTMRSATARPRRRASPSGWSDRRRAGAGTARSPRGRRRCRAHRSARRRAAGSVHSRQARAIARRWRCPPTTRRERTRPCREPQEVEHIPGPGLGRLAPSARDHRRERHVLEHGHALEQVEELEDDADVACAACRRARPRSGRHLLVGERDLPLVRVIEPRDEVQQRGLAAPGGAHDRDELPAVHLEVGPAQGAHGRVLRLEGAPDAAHVEDQVGAPTRRGWERARWWSCRAPGLSLDRQAEPSVAALASPPRTGIEGRVSFR